MRTGKQAARQNISEVKMNIATTPTFSTAAPFKCEPVEFSLPPNAQALPLDIPDARAIQLDRHATYADQTSSLHIRPQTYTTKEAATKEAGAVQASTTDTCEFSLAQDFQEALEFFAIRRQKALQWVDLNELHIEPRRTAARERYRQEGVHSSPKSDHNLGEIIKVTLVWLAGAAVNIGCGLASCLILLAWITFNLVQSGNERV